MSQPEIGISEIDDAINLNPELFLVMLQNRGVTVSGLPSDITESELIDLCRCIVRKCLEQ
jgi:hypothetical protein